MKFFAALFLFQAFCAAGSPENSRLKEWGTPIPARVNLDVRWNAPTNVFPSSIWVYRLLPNRFSPEIISNLTVLCSFTDKDKAVQNTNGIIFKNSNGSRTLSISFLSGKISYETTEPNYGPTNLAQGVPTMSKMPKLATNFLAEVGINFSDLQKNTNGIPHVDFWEPLTWYFVNHTFITNIEFRAIDFRRAVDGIVVSGGDSGEIYFGEHGKISKIFLSWHNLEHYKSYPTITPEAMMAWIRKGKAVHGGVPMNFGDIDWLTIKSITIKKAEPCYYAGDPPSNWLYPFAALLATVDTGHGNVDVEIDCPIIGETKP